MLRILVLTSRFPDSLRPNLGNFIERQTLELAARPGVEVEVVAPIGRAPFPLSAGRVAGRWTACPRQEDWKGIVVHRLRFPQLPYLPVACVPRRWRGGSCPWPGRFASASPSTSFRRNSPGPTGPPRSPWAGRSACRS